MSAPASGLALHGDRHKEERHTMAEKMTRGHFQDLVGKFAPENPKSVRRS